MKTFSGDIAGTSVTRALVAMTAQGPAGYVAIELMEASVHGRMGTADSGTGELEGLSDRGEIAVDAGGHTLSLD